MVKRNEQEAYSRGYRLELCEGDDLVGSVYLFVMKTDRHDEPYATMENLYVEEAYRGRGHGRALTELAIERARELGCYKLLGQSRYGNDRAHELYMKLGFKDHGKNFRIDLLDSQSNQA